MKSEDEATDDNIDPFEDMDYLLVDMYMCVLSVCQYFNTVYTI